MFVQAIIAIDPILEIIQRYTSTFSENKNSIE